MSFLCLRFLLTKDLPKLQIVVCLFIVQPQRAEINRAPALDLLLLQLAPIFLFTFRGSGIPGAPCSTLPPLMVVRSTTLWISLVTLALSLPLFAQAIVHFNHVATLAMLMVRRPLNPVHRAIGDTHPFLEPRSARREHFRSYPRLESTTTGTDVRYYCHLICSSPRPIR